MLKKLTVRKVNIWKNILRLKLKVRKKNYHCAYCKLFVKLFNEGHHKFLDGQKTIENKNDLKKSIEHVKADKKCNLIEVFRKWR